MKSAPSRQAKFSELLSYLEILQEQKEKLEAELQEVSRRQEVLLNEMRHLCWPNDLSYLSKLSEVAAGRKTIKQDKIEQQDVCLKRQAYCQKMSPKYDKPITKPVKSLSLKQRLNQFMQSKQTKIPYKDLNVFTLVHSQRALIAKVKAQIKNSLGSLYNLEKTNPQFQNKIKKLEVLMPKIGQGNGETIKKAPTDSQPKHYLPVGHNEYSQQKFNNVPNSQHQGFATGRFTEHKKQRQ